MDNPELIQLILMGFAALCGGAVIYVLVLPVLSGERQTEKRILGVTENKATRSQRRSHVDVANSRRKQVADTLKELEARQKAKEKLTLRLRLEQAGLDITPSTFWIGSAVSGVVSTVAVFVSQPHLELYVYPMVAAVAGLGLPRWVLAKVTKRRQAKFLSEFANSIDIIVRGVKSGLPLNECLGIISREAPSPIREEFVEIVEQQRVGVPLADCFERMMKRTPLAEVKFFAIVIGIQQQAGGNLSDSF
jgi:tight adherence protein B